MKTVRIVLALVASVAMIVIGQRHQAGRKGLRTQKADIQGFDRENETLFI
ncbi:hypothetical protein [Candidatus Palauibacter sp.]